MHSYHYFVKVIPNKLLFIITLVIALSMLSIYVYLCLIAITGQSSKKNVTNLAYEHHSWLGSPSINRTGRPSSEVVPR